MNPADIIAELRKSILVAGKEAYKANLKLPPEGMDEDYADIARLYQSLDINGQQALISLIHLVSVDAVSQTLAWFDGVIMLAQQDDFPKVTLGNNASEINGELQDIWLALEEGDTVEELR